MTMKCGMSIFIVLITMIAQVTAMNRGRRSRSPGISVDLGRFPMTCDQAGCEKPILNDDQALHFANCRHKVHIYHAEDMMRCCICNYPTCIDCHQKLDADEVEVTVFNDCLHSVHKFHQLSSCPCGYREGQPLATLKFDSDSTPSPPRRRRPKPPRANTNRDDRGETTPSALTALIHPRRPTSTAPTAGRKPDSHRVRSSSRSRARPIPETPEGFFDSNHGRLPYNPPDMFESNPQRYPYPGASAADRRASQMNRETEPDPWSYDSRPSARPMNIPSAGRRSSRPAAGDSYESIQPGAPPQRGPNYYLRDRQNH